jgi:dihydrofolate reductase
LAAVIGEQDTVLLGRVSYEYWAPHWPTAQDEPFATFINNTPKYVVSSTLEEPLAWQNSRLLKGDLADAVSALKEQAGKNIGVHASPTLVQGLLELDLVDEMHLLVFPVIAGQGMRLFQEGTMKRLKLIQNKRSVSGIALMAYARDRGTTSA